MKRLSDVVLIVCLGWLLTFAVTGCLSPAEQERMDAAVAEIGEIRAEIIAKLKAGTLTAAEAAAAVARLEVLAGEVKAIKATGGTSWLDVILGVGISLLTGGAVGHKLGRGALAGAVAGAVGGAISGTGSKAAAPP
jgi:hypothetical protein